MIGATGQIQNRRFAFQLARDLVGCNRNDRIQRDFCGVDQVFTGLLTGFSQVMQVPKAYRLPHPLAIKIGSPSDTQRRSAIKRVADTLTSWPDPNRNFASVRVSAKSETSLSFQ